MNTWKRKTITDYTARELLVPVFKDGKQVYDSPSIEEIRDYCARQVDLLWEEVRRFDNPHPYIVDLSLKLWTIKNDLVDQYSSKKTI